MCPTSATSGPFALRSGKCARDSIVRGVTLPVAQIRDTIRKTASHGRHAELSTSSVVVLFRESLQRTLLVSSHLPCGRHVSLFYRGLFQYVLFQPRMGSSRSHVFGVPKMTVTWFLDSDKTNTLLEGTTLWHHPDIL